MRILLVLAAAAAMMWAESAAGLKWAAPQGWTPARTANLPLSKVTKATVHGLPVTRMDVSGTYTASGGAAMTSQTPKAGNPMLAAIVEGPQTAAFDALIASFQK